MIHFIGRLEERCMSAAARHLPRCAPYLRRYQRVVRYLIAGSIAAAVNLGTLYFFTDILDVWYLFSSVLSFLVTFFVSFALQKFWTFRDKETKGIHTQGLLYFALALANLAVNSALLFFFVEVLRIWYLLSQVFAAGLIATATFFIYRNFIFKRADSAIP